MIVTLIFGVAIVAGVILLVIASNIDSYYDEGIAMLGLGSLVVGIVATFICVVVIISAHAVPQHKIEKDKIERDAIVTRLEKFKTLEGDTNTIERFSELDVLKEVEKWNLNVSDYKFYVKSPWTSWFYAQEVADALEYIDYPTTQQTE